MKLVIVSDTHFGDPRCALIDHDTLGAGNRYEAFRSAAGTGNDFLVLLGDIFDLSIATYREAYERARAFLLLVQRDEIAKGVIYVPGNHDFDMWHTVQHQLRVIRRVRDGKPPQDFRWTQPGFIDDRTDRTGLGNDPGFILPGAIDSPIDPTVAPEEELYLNHITRGEGGQDLLTRFFFAYPNLYLASDTETCLLTHGHYLETFWSLGGEWIPKVANSDLKSNGPMEDLVSLNMPLCQLACSGIGQAGALSPLVRELQSELKRKDTRRAEKYLDQLDDAIDEELDGGVFFEAGTDLVSNLVKKKIKEALRAQTPTRYRCEIWRDPDVRARFSRFHSASMKEIEQLNKKYKLGIPTPETILLGHTHCPIGMDDGASLHLRRAGNPVRLLNTGGWLWRPDRRGGRQFSGAEVFRYDTATGLDSVRVE